MSTSDRKTNETSMIFQAVCERDKEPLRNVSRPAENKVKFKEGWEEEGEWGEGWIARFFQTLITTLAMQES